MNAISYKLLREPVPGEFDAEASELSLPPGRLIPNPLVVEMPNGEPVKFWLVRTERDPDGDLMLMHYASRRRNMTLTVFND